ncbi:LLM class flavin-dependent oxidoreductase [Embleya sp. NPDC127516]|uniref:LLM class flavin-dependent oxidoreductase n=1 Tax=Embleya sp. NPDC127516 TaxID=3363990 RepID=UPI0038244B64
MRLGFLTHVAGAGDDARAVYRETIELAVAAEEFGYDSFWVAQHHLGAQGASAPSPFVLLAAIAERTTRIRLGTAVVVAPTEHPIRLAEDAAALDTLSAGRLELGLGAGSDPATFEAFGVPYQVRHARLRETVDTVLDLLTGADLVPSAPTLRDRIWLGTGSPEGIAWAVERGLGILSGRRSSGPAGPLPGDREAAEHLARYTPTRVALSRPVHPGASTVLTERLIPWITRGRAAGRFPVDFTPTDYLAIGNMYTGTPQTVARSLRADPGYPHATELLCHTQPARLPPAALLPVMRRTAHEVRPLLRAAAAEVT